MSDHETSEARDELTRLWLIRALRDLESAKKLATGKVVYLDTASYHCQQAGEKAVKGFLAFHGHEILKTHDLELLIGHAASYQPELERCLRSARLLTPYATRFRYLDDVLEPSREEFEQAVGAATDLYQSVLSFVPAEVHP